MRSIAIKNLCIALEALSRISGSGPERESERIHDLLDDLLKEEEQRKRTQETNEDEIPF